MNSPDRPADSPTTLATLADALAQLTARIETLDRRVGELVALQQGQVAKLPPAPKTPPVPVSVPATPPRPAPAAAALPAPLPAGKRRLNVLIMGARLHGGKHVDNFLALADCRIAYICDVDAAVAQRAALLVESKTGERPKVVKDLRDALSDGTLDIVSIATPHHWHALAAIWSLQAGKHVYVEKPLGHNFAEGESIIAAAKKYGRMVQFGTQLRSNGSLMAASEYMRSGKLGDVNLVHCITYKPRPAMVHAPVNQVPDSVNYDLWCGPAPMDALTRSRLHYHWHWFWDFGNGALGNNGIHRIDVARIGLGLKGLGRSVSSYGGRFGPPDTGETPNTHVVIHRFDSCWVVQEVRGMPTKAYRGVSNGILFFGKTGTVAYQKGFAVLRDLKGVEVERFPGKQQNHYRNFVDAIHAGDASRLAGDLYEGHVSSGLCHLGNISHRLGEEADDSRIAEAVGALGAPAPVSALLSRMREHRTANGVNERFTLGRTLQIDETRRPILADPDAAALLTRTYRPPYVVPAPDAV